MRKLASFQLDESDLPRAQEAVRGIARRLDLLRKLEPYADRAWSGIEDDRPTLYLDDVSEIPFLVDISGVEEYQHRARVRAGEGDLFATVTQPAEGYEEYCRERLRLASPEHIVTAPVSGPLAVARACAEGEAFQQIIARARESGGLKIHPYMSIKPVWKLARLVADETRALISVIGSPPPTTWIANDKALFGEVVRNVLGDEWLVETHAAREPRALGDLLLSLAKRYPRVGLKRLRCASAMGNAVFEGRELRERGRSGVEEVVRAFLERTEWDGREETLAVAWEETELSPSSQTWIPPLGVGSPRVEGVYEQILEGQAKVFVGSRPSTLPMKLVTRLAVAALKVAAGLQALGYVGRCSFDNLVLGDPHGDCSIRFTECNGRWGGTSVPMHLVDRLMGNPRPPYRAQDLVHKGLVGASFPEVLARVGDEAFETESGHGRFIFYNVGPLKRSGKLDVIALGRTQEEADEALQCDLPRLLGL